MKQERLPLWKARQWSFPSMVIYFAGYTALLVWFRWIDIYHAHFESTGRSILLYNISRAAFIFYLFWMVHAVGSLFLRVFVRSDQTSVGALDSLALRFFAGTGVWHVVMLALGFLNLYRPYIAVVITVPIILFSYFDARQAIARFYPSDTFGLQSVPPGGWDRKSNIIIAAALAATFLAVFVSLLLVKGLYPAGGHDYFNHYFYYLQSAIQHHGLWPNEVWYHFYYSKGAGLYFLGILLTDPLAPQLVTFCFVIAGSIALFQFLSRVAPQTWWPHVGVILYLGLYIYTPGVAEYKANGGWGDFEKLHELNAALVIAILWMTSAALERRGRNSIEWLIAASSATVAAIIVNITIAAYLGAIFAAVMVWYLLKGRRSEVLACFILASVSGVTLVGILSLNYFATGLLDDQGILLFWKYANLEKLYNWGALPDVIMLHWATTGLVANSVPWSSKSAEFLFLSLRLDLLWPLVGGGILASLIGVLTRRVKLDAGEQAALLVAAIVAYLALALAAGRSQPISFFRYSSFILAVSIAAGVTFWTSLRWENAGEAIRWTFGAGLPLLVLAGCFAAAFATYQPGAFSTILTNAWRFARGTYSIDNAYVTQNGWAGRLPWGGIYPGARGAYSIVGPNVPIRSMHVHSYCMLPDCRMETYQAFTIGRDWDRLMFGTPEEGRQALQSAGLNYFLFSRELAKELGIVDILPRSQLFSPDNIGRYLGIRWTDGDTALLTWIGPDTKPLDENWIADYRRAVAKAKVAHGFPYDAMKKIFAHLRATPHPWRPFDLPWEGNGPY